MLYLYCIYIILYLYYPQMMHIDKEQQNTSQATTAARSIENPVYTVSKEWSSIFKQLLKEMIKRSLPTRQAKQSLVKVHRLNISPLRLLLPHHWLLQPPQHYWDLHNHRQQQQQAPDPWFPRSFHKTRDFPHFTYPLIMRLSIWNEAWM